MLEKFLLKEKICFTNIVGGGPSGFEIYLRSLEILKEGEGFLVIV